MSKYLRGRPFLVVTFIQRPKKTANTKLKGWMNDPNNVQIFEQVSVVDRINDKEMLSPIIVDLVEGVAVRNNSGKDDDLMIAHYVGKYAETIKKALKKWAGDKLAAELNADSQ